MRAFKFMVVDLLKCRLQVLFMILFTGLALLFMVRSKTPLSGMFYMSFAAVIMGIQPFMQEQSSEVGFLYMLPGTKKTRVAGRYLYGLILQALSVLLSLAAIAVYRVGFGGEINGIWGSIIICFSIGLIFIALQNILFYALGKMESQQIAGIIMMIPGFIMFFGINFALENGVKFLSPYLEWMRMHPGAVYGTMAAAAFVIWCAGIVISGWIIKGRDDI